MGDEAKQIVGYVVKSTDGFYLRRTWSGFPWGSREEAKVFADRPNQNEVVGSGRVVRLVRRKRCPEGHAVCAPPGNEHPFGAGCGWVRLDEHARLVDEANARLATATSLLREVEWGDAGPDDDHCPSCSGRSIVGHVPGCRLAAFLSEK